MGRITVKQLEAVTVADDGKVFREDGGLVGKVRAGVRGVTVLFRYEFKLGGHKRDHRLGAWPKRTLAEIRAERDRVRVLVVDGIDPTAAKKAERIQKQQAIERTIKQAEEASLLNRTVRELFNAWLADGVARQDGNAELKRLFSKDVLPTIGAIPLRDLSEQNILSMLRKMLERNVTRLAVVAHNDVSQMLSWGEKRQPWRGLLVNGNPCNLVDINTLLPHDYEEERDRVLSPAELKELAVIFRRMEEEWQSAPDRRSATRPVKTATQISLWLCLGTLSRIGELLMARWEHVDLDKRVWFIPRENVKGRRGKKQEHYIFLSDFSCRQFEELKKITGESEWCFPSKNKKGEETHVCLKSVSKQVGDRQVRFKNRRQPLKGRAFDDSLVLAEGVNGEWTPHDLRRTGATMMQSLGVSLDVIDRCQNHVLSGGRVRRHYLHHDYREEKTDAWKRLGEHLDSILGTITAPKVEFSDDRALSPLGLEDLFLSRLKQTAAGKGG